MAAETLDGDFYRERAHLCHQLAEAATGAKPLFARLIVLAKAYEEKAKAADLAAGQADRKLKSPSDLHCLPQQLAS